MNEEQYFSICAACDKLLRAADTTLERVSIPWLHVIREHPVFLENYEHLFRAGHSSRALVQKWLRLLRNGVGWCLQFGRSLRFHGRPWSSSRELSDQIDVLFVSHLVNTNHAGQSEDFYYGDVPNELARRGHTVAISMLNQSNQLADSLVEKWKTEVVPRVVLSRSLGIAEEVSIFRRLRGEARRLRKLAIKEKPGLYQSILLRSSEEALSGGARMTLRIGEQIRALVVKHHPKVIVVTHEGHAWERTVFAAARSAAPGIRCIGYQHAALFRLQHAIRRNLAVEFNPDVIMTSGAVSKKQLEHAPELQETPVVMLGSNRLVKKPTDRAGDVAARQRDDQSRNHACLILPEGIPGECHLMFEFSLECARNCPSIQFIWRLHPIVSFDSLMAANPALRNLPGNIELSRASLEEDLDRCRWALYRGTTAIVQAVVSGLRPIYLKIPGEMTIDPLYELEGWRKQITDVSEFERIVTADVAGSEPRHDREQERARQYCDAFFMPFDISAMTAQISN